MTAASSSLNLHFCFHLLFFCCYCWRTYCLWQFTDSLALGKEVQGLSAADRGTITADSDFRSARPSERQLEIRDSCSHIFTFLLLFTFPTIVNCKKNNFFRDYNLLCIVQPCLAKWQINHLDFFMLSHTHTYLYYRPYCIYSYSVFIFIFYSIQSPCKNTLKA